MIAAIANAVSRLPSGIADMMQAGRLDEDAQLVRVTASADLRRLRARDKVIADLDKLRDARARLVVRAEVGFTRRRRLLAAELVASADRTILDLERMLADIEALDRGEVAGDEGAPRVFRASEERGT